MSLFPWSPYSQQPSRIPQLPPSEVERLMRLLEEFGITRVGSIGILPPKARLSPEMLKFARSLGWDAVSMELALAALEAKHQYEAARTAGDESGAAKWKRRHEAVLQEFQEHMESLGKLPPRVVERTAGIAMRRAARERYGPKLKEAFGSAGTLFPRFGPQEHAVPPVVARFMKWLLGQVHGDPGLAHLHRLEEFTRRRIAGAEAAGRHERARWLEGVHERIWNKIRFLKSRYEPSGKPPRGYRSRRAPGPIIPQTAFAPLPIPLSYERFMGISRSLGLNIPETPGAIIPERFVRVAHQILTLPHGEQGRETFLRLFRDVNVSYLQRHEYDVLRDFYKALEAGPMTISTFRSWLRVLPRPLLRDVQATLSKTLYELVQRGAIAVRQVPGRVPSDRERGESQGIRVKRRYELVPPGSPKKWKEETQMPTWRGNIAEEFAKYKQRKEAERAAYREKYRQSIEILKRLDKENRGPQTPEEWQAVSFIEQHEADWKAKRELEEMQMRRSQRLPPRGQPRDYSAEAMVEEARREHRERMRAIRRDPLALELERQKAADAKSARELAEARALYRMIEAAERKAPEYPLEQHPQLIRDILTGTIKQLDEIPVSGALAFVPPHYNVGVFARFLLPALVARVSRLAPGRWVSRQELTNAIMGIPSAYFMLGAGPELPDKTVLETARLGWHDRNKIARALKAAFVIHEDLPNAAEAAAQVLRRVLRSKKYQDVLTQKGRNFLAQIVNNPRAPESRAAMSAIVAGTYPREQAHELFGEIERPFIDAIKRISKAMQRAVQEHIPHDPPQDTRNWARFYAAVAAPQVAYPKEQALSPSFTLDPRRGGQLHVSGLPQAPLLANAHALAERIREILPPSARRRIPQVARDVAETYNKALQATYGAGNVVRNRLLGSDDVNLIVLLLEHPEFLEDFMLSPAITTSTFMALLSGRLPEAKGKFGSETRLLTPVMAMGHLLERIVRHYDPDLKFGDEAFRRIRETIATMADNAGIRGLDVIRGTGPDRRMHYAISFAGSPYETSETLVSFLPLAIFHRIVPALALYAQHISGHTPTTGKMVAALQNIDSQVKEYLLHIRKQRRGMGTPENLSAAAEHFAALLANAMESGDKSAEIEIMEAVRKYASDLSSRLPADKKPTSPDEARELGLARNFSRIVRTRAWEIVKFRPGETPAVTVLEHQIAYPPIRGSAG